MLNDEIGRLAKERQQLASQLKEVGEFISHKLQPVYFYTWRPLIVVKFGFYKVVGKWIKAISWESYGQAAVKSALAAYWEKAQTGAFTAVVKAEF